MKIIKLSDVSPDETSYLVRPYLPRGTLCLFDGDPEAGKSFAILSLAAAITQGIKLPFEPEGEVRQPANVVYLGVEDGGAVVLKRAKAQGADIERIFVLAGQAAPLTDVAEYRKIIVDTQAALLIVDPLQSVMGAINMNSMTSVRAVLQPIIDLAAETGCTVLGVRHLNKSAGSRAAYRGMGSIDFRAAARSVMRLGRDPRQPTRRVLVHSKFSLGVPGLTQEYEIADGRVHWAGRSELTERDLDEREPRQRHRTAIEVASDFLSELLATGPVRAKEARRMARRAGIAVRTLEDAKKKLGVLSRRIAGVARGEGYWEWFMLRVVGPAADVPGAPGVEAGDQDREAAPLDPGLNPGSDLDLGLRDQGREDDNDAADWWKRGDLN